MAGTNPLRISKDEITASFAAGNWADRFPPILTVDQVAELLGVSKATVYGWSSQGRFRSCSQKLGKHLRFFRDRFVQTVMNEGI